MVSHVDLMAKAQRDLRSALLTFEHGDPDAAANRAYYAMYHAASAALMAIGQPRLALAKTHRGVISAFAKHLVQPGHVPSVLSRMIGGGEKDRIIADYTGDGVGAAVARRLIDDAEVFVSSVGRFIESQKGS